MRHERHTLREKKTKKQGKNGRLTLDNILRVTLGEDAQMMCSDPWRGGGYEGTETSRSTLTRGLDIPS